MQSRAFAGGSGGGISTVITRTAVGRGRFDLERKALPTYEGPEPKRLLGLPD